MQVWPALVIRCIRQVSVGDLHALSKVEELGVRKGLCIPLTRSGPDIMRRAAQDSQVRERVFREGRGGALLPRAGSGCHPAVHGQGSWVVAEWLSGGEVSADRVQGSVLVIARRRSVP